MEETTTDDAAAIAATLAGDREAFGGLIARHEEAAFRAAYLILRDAAAAEDAAQDAFVRAYRGLAGFRDGAPFRPWLLRIVTNTALNAARGRGRREGLFARLASAPAANEPPPERAIVVDEERRMLWDAINSLPGDDRMVLYLRHFLELPEREIATVIGKAPGTVKSRLSRASLRLRRVIEARYPSLRPGGEGGGDD